MKDLKSFKHELQDIITGNDNKGSAYLIKAAQNHIRPGQAAGEKTEIGQLTRAEEEKALIDFASTRNLWIPERFFGEYITEGAEQKVYFPEEGDHVIKLTDGIFYQYWADYFNNLLLHNVFFPNTAYELLGFHQRNSTLYAVVKQAYITVTEITDLVTVKDFLLSNGFEHKKNNDYFHPYLGIILEDLHDENVLTNKKILFFVDTVFYITDEFYNNK